MVTTVTVSSDPVQIWQRAALAELEQAFGQSLDLWIRNRSEGWTLSETATARVELDSFEETSPIDLPELLEQVTCQGEPQARQQALGHYLLVIPLGNRAAAITTVRTDSPDAFVSLANISSRYFCQQEEMTRLHEENDYFLKQVSDDFEELTFLRSMAERLGLGVSTHTLEQLVTTSLPLLGKSAHAEKLFFVLAAENELKIIASWEDEKTGWNACEPWVVRQLIKTFQNTDEARPVIKNNMDSSTSNKSFPGVRDFILVPVGRIDASLGWYLAINRLSEMENQDFPEWRLNQHEFGTSEASLLSTAAAMADSHANNLSLFQEREALLVNVVRTLVSAVEAKDQYTCGHSERVALYAKRIAEQVGYDEEACELLYLTGLLHDIGKIAINDAILNKPGQLTGEEFAEIQRHPHEGWKILHELQQLSYVLPGVLHHHERFDGQGYPDGLVGQNIPLDGRLLAVADAYDAMTSDRAYRTGMPHDKAISILCEGAGSQWDAEAVEAFLAIESEIITIRESYQPREKTDRVPTPASSPTH